MNSPNGQPQALTHVVADPSRGGMPAFAFDHPAGWRAESHLVWNPNNMNNPVLVFARAGDPAGPDGWELFPNQDCFLLSAGGGGMGGGMGGGFGSGWGGDPLTAMMGQALGGLFGGGGGQPGPGGPAGGPVLGLTPPGPRHVAVGGLPYGPEPSRPLHPGEALSRFVIPKFRGRCPGLRVLGIRPVPQLAEMLGVRDVAAVPHDGASARITYQVNGHPVEEEFLCGGYVMPQTGGQLNWGLKPIMSFRSAPRQLDGLLQRCGWIAQSVRANPQYEAMVGQVQAQMAAGQQAAQWAQNQDVFANEARERQGRADYFENRQQAQAAAQAQGWQSFTNRVEGFGDAMMGRTAYIDPSSATGQPHYDTGHHQYVWTDGQGNFRHTNDPNLDPNVGSDRSWTMARQPTDR